MIGGKKLGILLAVTAVVLFLVVAAMQRPADDWWAAPLWVCVLFILWWSLWRTRGAEDDEPRPAFGDPGPVIDPESADRVQSRESDPVESESGESESGELVSVESAER